VAGPNDPVGATGRPVLSAGRVTPDGTRIYRLIPPVVIWWAWIIVVLIGVGDVAVQGHTFIPVPAVFALLTITGLVYACTLWPRVIADADGIVVQNPFRSFDIPWRAVTGIFLGDFIEVQCRRPGSKKDKTVYTWALTSGRRARARADLRSSQRQRGRRSVPAEYARMPEQARLIAEKQPADLIARELAELSEQAKVAPEPDSAAGANAAVVSASWSWQPLAATFVPAAAFAISMLLR